MIPTHPSRREPIENWHTNPRLVSGRANKQVGISTLLPVQQGIPQPVSGVGGSKLTRLINGQKWIAVNLIHSTNPSDQAFSHAQVWAKNYLGNPNFQLISGSETSPHSLLFPPTGDNVVFAIRSIGRDGSLLPLTQSPTHTIQLS